MINNCYAGGQVFVSLENGIIKILQLITNNNNMGCLFGNYNQSAIFTTLNN